MLLVCSMAAYEFAFYRFPGRNVLFGIALAALMVPQAVTVIPTYVIVVRFHWLNSIQGLAVPGMASAFGLFILRQFMETIPKELLAAAEIDGASHFGAYRRVALPLSSNALVTLSVLTFMSSWGSYLWPLIISTKSAWFTVSLTVAKFIGSQSHFTINVVMTVAFLSSLPPILFFFIFQRRIVEGVALTGLKG
jgi:multiple sugar transport system permease protein